MRKIKNIKKRKQDTSKGHEITNVYSRQISWWALNIKVRLVVDTRGLNTYVDGLIGKLKDKP